MKFAIIKTGGKQYLVKENDELYVDYLRREEKEEVEFETLAQADEQKNDIELGTPTLRHKVKAKILENIKGDKIRVARFKAKSRYRKVKGFRPKLSKVRIISV